MDKWLRLIISFFFFGFFIEQPLFTMSTFEDLTPSPNRDKLGQHTRGRTHTVSSLGRGGVLYEVNVNNEQLQDGLCALIRYIIRKEGVDYRRPHAFPGDQRKDMQILVTVLKLDEEERNNG